MVRSKECVKPFMRAIVCLILSAFVRAFVHHFTVTRLAASPDFAPSFFVVFNAPFCAPQLNQAAPRQQPHL